MERCLLRASLKEKEAMMYSNNLAVAIKANGKILREFGDTVYVPFGQEYTIFIRNLNTVRAQVRITIDGKDATDGNVLIVDANSSVELKRFIRNGNLSEGNSFKFIERTAAIEAHRGIEVEDGLIRIEFQWELPPVFAQPAVRSWIGSASYASSSYAGTGGGNPDWELLNTTTTASTEGFKNWSRSLSAEPITHSIAAGVTAPGSINSQKFQMVEAFVVAPEKHALVIKLVGESERGEPVKQAVTVKSKVACKMCGTKSKAGTKYCPECGSSLQIV